jgi:hypothetical protein
MLCVWFQVVILCLFAKRVRAHCSHTGIGWWCGVCIAARDEGEQGGNLAGFHNGRKHGGGEPLQIDARPDASLWHYHVLGGISWAMS